MHLLKPLWLKHGGEKKDFEVYSCHVSPDGQRLVTAAGDCYLRIWSTEAIYNGTSTDYAKPKQLAAISHHTGTIHTVRFSGNNKYIASGADDRYVCVYILDSSAPPTATFGSNEAPPVENWRVYRRLLGHENDVQDLGWSYDSSVLVSVGLDSRIVVWSGYTFEKLKTLSHHGSHVKGITFDPANKYFATASDDRTIKVFRFTPPAPNATAHDQANNFQLEKSISDPFTSSPLTTYFRRCSWSPDGNHIAAANAVNGPVSTAVIIERGSWESNINLIGHEAPVEVCAFSPRLFSRTPLPDRKELDSTAIAKQGCITVVALAGQDRALSIWNTTSSKPLCVNENLALKSISDIAWTPEGESVFFTSLDGSICVLRFSKGELGYPVPLEVNESSLAKYGAGRKVGMVEGPEGLMLEEKSKDDELRNVQGRMGELMGDGRSPKKATNEFTVAPVKPINIPNGAADTAANDTTKTASEKEETKPAQTAEEAAYKAREEKIKQRVTVTKDGKKRVAPMLVSSAAGSTESSLPTARLMSANQGAARNDAPQTVLDFSKPFEGLPKGGVGAMVFGNKRKLAETGAEDDNAIAQRIASADREGTTAVLLNTTDGLVAADATPSQLANVTRPSLLSPSLLASQIRLAVPLIRSTIIRPLNGAPTPLEKDAGNINSETGNRNLADDNPLMEVRNPPTQTRTGRAQDREPARISVVKRGATLWQDYLPKAVSLVTGNVRFWAATSEDGSLYVWSPSGARILNACALESQATILDCRGPYLLIVTAVGLCHVLNIEQGSALHPKVSLAPVLDIAATSQTVHLTGGPGIVFARMTSEGRIVVGLTNGDAYAYNPAIDFWQRLSEAWWAVSSQYWNANESASQTASSNRAAGEDLEEGDVVRLENVSAGVIPYIERNTTAQTMLRGRAFSLQRVVKSLLSAEGYEGFESAVSVAHLENRVAAALSLHAKEEFKQYLCAYAKRLGAEGARLKIEELLRSLMRGIDQSQPAKSTSEAPIAGIVSTPTEDLCGWKKETLLREVILILGKFRDLQRITVPYARLLGVTVPEANGEDGSSKEKEGMMDTT